MFRKFSMFEERVKNYQSSGLNKPTTDELTRAVTMMVHGFQMYTKAYEEKHGEPIQMDKFSFDAWAGIGIGLMQFAQDGDVGKHEPWEIENIIKEILESHGL